MKKTLLALAVGALAVASTANAGWYAEGDAGISRTKFTSYGDMNKTKIEPRVAVGYKLGNVRVAGDYTYHGKFSGQAAGEQTSARVQGLGASVIYDIDTGSQVQPYIGARVAANHFKVNHSDSSNFRETSETKLGYGALAGAKYKLDHNWYANGAVEYNRLGTYDDTKINNYGAKVGVGYEF
ncbi:opacity family porin [Haemophilus pittmaniae]|uniref:opacity family porin n=1 Tax=Haemophilus pittmaniae TaxID=249188 RepID=UPI0028DCD913|nr:opacity family porin [Haemophilus pittmaniae]